MPLAVSRLAGVVIGAVGVEEVLAVLAVEPSLPAPQLRGGDPSGPQIVDGLLDLRDPSFEGAQDGHRRAGEPTLEDPHREPHGRAVVEGPVVGPTQVGGGRVVERLLAVGARAQVVAERVAHAAPVQRRSVEGDHLFLDPADEVAAARLARKAPERLPGGEHPGVEQPPQVVVGRVLAHVGRRGQQQQVLRRPAEAGVPARGTGAPGQRLGELVPPALAHAVLLLDHAQLVGLVEDDEVVGGYAGLPHRVERPLAGQGVERHDDEVALGSAERVLRRRAIRALAGRARAGRDTEPQPEQRTQLALPVADEPGRRHDEHAADSAAGQHLADVEAGHDRLAGSGVVGQQEAQRLLREHPLVDRDALVRQGVDARDLGGEGRIELVTVGQAHGLGHRRYGVRVAREVERHCREERPGGRRSRCARLGGERVFQLAEAVLGQTLRTRLARFPAVDGNRGDAQSVGELALRQSQALANAPDLAAVSGGRGE